MGGKTMTTMMLALTNALSVARTNALLLDDIKVGSFWWLSYAGISCFLVLFAGIMSGLTLGLMSLGLVDLEILQRSGTSQEKKQAGARCVGTLLHEMKRRGRDCRFGVISMCIATGMGVAAVFERGDCVDELCNAKKTQACNLLSRDAL